MELSFRQWLRNLNEDAPPPPPGGDPSGGGAPPPPGGPPGGDPMGGPPGGDPLGGGGQPMTRKAIHVTSVWEALKQALGKDAEKTDEGGKRKPESESRKRDIDSKKPKSLIQ